MKCWSMLLTGCALALIIIAPVEAQWGGGRERPSAEEIAKRQQEARAKLFEELRLDEAQIKLVDSLLTVRDERRMEMMEEMRASFGDREAMQDMRKEMGALQADTDENIRAALTEEQLKLFQAIRDKEAEGRVNRRGRRREGGGGDGGSRI
jgi:hypothetical protein